LWEFYPQTIERDVLERALKPVSSSLSLGIISEPEAMIPVLRPLLSLNSCKQTLRYR
jgi:hypothetical protein